MFGKTHTPESKAKMSDSQQLVDRSGAMTGALNHMYGKTHTPETRAKMSDSHTGITPTNAMTINVYSIDGTLINFFSSQVAVAKWLGVNQSTVSRHIKSGKVWNNLYRFVKSMS